MNISPEEFERYAQGRSSADEKAKIEQWLNSPEQEELSESGNEQERLQEVWEALAPVTQMEAPQNFKFGFQFILKIAACLFIGVAATTWLWTSRQHINDTTFETAQFQTIRTAKGENLKITLSDGSVVILNAMSSLSYPKRFAGSQRLVQFKGEAFFSIARNEAMPFIVQTDSSFTRVLGTRFNLKAYSNESVALTVAHGKVQFGRPNSSDQVVLTVGMQGKIEKYKPVFSQLVNPERYTAWTTRTFTMDNERLDAVAIRLERWFGVKVNVSSAQLKALTVTGDFKNPSLQKILSSLSFSTGFQYQITEQTVNIY
ncbi:FecR domain-containing protein [Pedobacter sp. MC2016-14]|uniref:FecR family protein n=1 Tax=Pedobacter sp. MC2016-14 TaxID=2897327 RepID=UPI001E38BDE3|nr:FecR domain-containing protein [Pedobacter sp. MC2016-14]MCD0489157.1 FecR domain-containing protein [Pedobacter sp. MC2016-14]